MNKGFVVDTNILISALVTPNGTIAKLVFRDLNNYRLISPQFLFDEVISKYDKILKITGYKDNELKGMIYNISRKIYFIDDKLIAFNYQSEAYNLVKDIDKKNLLFVALSIKTGFPLWTGDIKLINGLKKNRFSNVIDTSGLMQIIQEN